MADEIDEKDDLHGAVAAAFDALDGGDNGAAGDREPEAAGGPAPGSEGTGAVRERDEAGRFKAKDTERSTLTLKEKPETVAEPAAPSATTPAPTAPEPGKPEPIAPPSDWKGASKVKWDRLPREVQTELVGMHQALATERAEVAPFKELLDVNRDFLINQAGSLPAAMTQLMQFARMSVDNPQALIQHIARSSGIDLRSFAGQPEQGAGQAAPNQTADIAELVRQQLQPILGQIQQQSLQQEVSKVQAFRDDPKHPYFNDVAPRIEQLLKAGAAKDLQDAYDQAIWADPTIRQQLLSAQAEEAKRQQTADAEKARKAAAASLRGSPLPGASLNGAGNQNSSVYDDVRAAAAELAGT